jgi:hypothetical protein
LHFDAPSGSQATVQLEPLARDQLAAALDEISDGGGSWATIVLTDGTALPARISPHGVLSGDRLVLEDNRTFSEHTISVPADRVAGVSPFAFRQTYTEQRFRRKVRKQPPSADDWLYRALTENAERAGLSVEFTSVLYRLPHERPIRWGGIEFRTDTPLYCDWQFLARAAGGINNVGVGFVVSVSAGWSKSLMSSFRKTVARTTEPLAMVCQHHEPACRGHVNLLAGAGDDHDGLSMEGARWLPAIMTERPVADGRVDRSGAWTLAYFREDGFMLPHALWDKLSQPIRVFGDVISTPAMTDYGAVSCFVKVRAAAFLEADD